MNMNFNFNWPSEEVIIEKNYYNTGIDLLKEKFGALSQDKESVYSRICIGNSLMSMEPYRGCPLGCKYCMANNDVRSLSNDNTKNCSLNSMIIKKPELLVDSRILANALINHPAFIPDKTIIGFCTGSSEFFLPEVGDNVWSGLKLFVEKGLKNPLWIVAKSFLDKGNEYKWIDRFKYLTDNGMKVILSISDTGASKEIEPFQTDRFKAFEFLKDSDVKISHHMRPITPFMKDLEETIDTLVEKSSGLVESICVGGLRIDPGMAIFWDKISDEKLKYIPGNQQKIFDENILKIVSDTLKKKNINIPVFIRTSEMLSYHLKISDFNLYKYRDKHAFLKIDNKKQYEIQQKYNTTLSGLFKNIANSIGLNDIYFSIIEDKVYLNKNLKYQEERALIHAIGHSGILE